MEGAHPPPSNKLGGLFDVVGSKTKLRYASSVATTSACSTSNTSSNTLDGRNPIPVDRQFMNLQGFMHPRWWRISSINKLSTN